MLAAADLDVLWVVGANPLKHATLASQNAFVVVQDLFLTETAQRADVVLPAASRLRKDRHGDQRLRRSAALEGAVARHGREARSRNHRPDRQGNGRRGTRDLARRTRYSKRSGKPCRGYNVPLPVIATGGAAQTAPVNGRVPRGRRPELIRSARDTLFTSGTLGRYSKILNSVLEAPGRHAVTEVRK